MAGEGCQGQAIISRWETHLLQMCELEGAGTQDRCGEGWESSGWPLQVPKEMVATRSELIGN